MSGVNGHAFNSSHQPPQEYIERALDEECAAIVSAAEGTSNTTLHKAALRIGSMVGADWLEHSEAEARLVAAAAQRCKDPDEARRTIKNGLDWGVLHPRDFNTVHEPSPVRARARRETVNSGKRERALGIWDTARPVEGTIGEVYLASRALDGACAASLRFSPSETMPGGTYHPALIAKVTNPVTGEFLAIQRTALLKDGSGKAAIKKNKAALGSTAGGAVVFGDLNDGRAILEGEGIETVLSACQATGLPGIATLSAGTLGKPQLPEGRGVIILTDLGSEKAARSGAQRRTAEGRKVQIGLPPKTCGKDFNDTLRALGVDAVTEAVDQAEDYRPSQRPTKYSSTSLAEVKPKPIWWLWPDRIARGKLGLLAGHPGRGKSQVSLYLQGIVSMGGTWPDGTRTEPANVILISCEDDLADTVVPRLKALGADLNRCHVLNGVPLESGEIRPFNLKADAAILEQMIDDIGNVALVVIDPISAYLDGIDSHKNSDVRGSLLPLQSVAERTGAAFLMVSHFNKGTPDSKAMSRVSGTGAFVAACRSAWIVENDPEDSDGKRRLFVPMKNNIGDDSTGFSFEIESVELGSEITTSRAKFLPGTVTVSADDLVRSEQGGSSRTSKEQEAADFLRDYLSSGPKPQREVETAAEAEGHRERTLQRAKKSLDIRSDKIGASWWWRLPDEDGATEDLFKREGCQDRHIASTDNSGNLAETNHKNGVAEGNQFLSSGNVGDVGNLGDVVPLARGGEHHG